MLSDNTQIIQDTCFLEYGIYTYLYVNIADVKYCTLAIFHLKSMLKSLCRVARSHHSLVDLDH